MKLYLYKLFFLSTIILLSNHLYSQRKLILVAGQSNCSGHGDSTYSPKVTKGIAFEYSYQKDNLKNLEDPVGENVLMFDKATTGSAWPSLATKLYQYTHDTIIIIPASRGGSALNIKAKMSRYDAWDSTSALFANAVKKVKAAEDKTHQKLDAIVWIQGERDASAIYSHQMSAQDYENSLKNLISRFRKELGENLPFFISIMGFPDNEKKSGFIVVQQIQRKVAKELKHVYIAADIAPKFIEQKK